MRKQRLVIILFLGLLFHNRGLSAQDRVLTIKVIAPANTPAKDTLQIVGSDLKWGDWFSRNGAKMKKESDNAWSYQAAFPVNSSLQFKVTRGSYRSEAIYTGGGFPPNINITLTKDTTIVLRPVNWNDLIENSVTGTLKYHHNFDDVNLRFTRDVFVWLPPSYGKDPLRRYPVLYMQDGQNLFDAGMSGWFGQEWHADEVADSLIREKAVEEFIIVGISNTRDRWLEYSGLERGKMYVSFMATHLKPFIDKTYRTKADRNNTAVMGSSMGGLIAFYSVLWFPEVFSKAACLSSGFVYDEASIMDKIAALPLPKQKLRVYLDCGDQQIDKYFLPDNERMYTVLKSKGIEEVVYTFEKGAEHNEKAWANRLWKPFIFLFGKK